MHGFGTVKAAARFCCAFDELRNYFRSRRTMREAISLQRLTDLQTSIRAAS